MDTPSGGLVRSHCVGTTAVFYASDYLNKLYGEKIEREFKAVPGLLLLGSRGSFERPLLRNRRIVEMRQFTEQHCASCRPPDQLIAWPLLPMVAARPA